MKHIHELFENQAVLTPEAVALEFQSERLTYRELNDRAAALANRLRGLGVGPDVLVALFLERSPEMIVGMLGVLKAGGSYVPLDPVLLPAKRLAYMLEDAKPLVVLVQDRLRAALPPHQAKLLVLDDDPAESEPVPSRAHDAREDDLAYVIYTSGSTGQPKGVQVKHAAVANMLGAVQRRPGISATDRMLALTTMAFDISVLEIFLPLSCGACVVIAPQEAARDGVALRRLIETSGVTIIQATPATLQMLLDSGWEGAPGLKILCGGEAWNAGLADALLMRCDSLWNMYGPTETTVWSAVAKVEQGKPVVVGRPIANTRFYVLDAALQLVPPGIPGELFIAGDGLAHGYLNRPELTAERFIADPFVGSGALMYRTGDRVKRLQNGTLEFLGRLDHQVKIRGHRIELGEIENVLAGHPDIERSVAVAFAGADGLQNIALYFIPAQGNNVSSPELRRYLGERLPPYMIPAAFVPLSAFPLTPSGKVDRKALPSPVAAPASDFIPPESEMEKRVAAIWAAMLKRDQIGTRDNFFDLGGHSLLALKVINEINKTLGTRLNVPDFFQGPTIEKLVIAMDHGSHRNPAARVVALQQGKRGLPIYFMGARPDEYRLAELISQDRSVFLVDVAFPKSWVDAAATENRKGLPSMEQLGELFGRALFLHIGKNPCILAGFSLGGKVAFEAAHFLRRAGGETPFIMLIDSRAFTWIGMAKVATVIRSAWIVLRDSVTKPGGVSAQIRRFGKIVRKTWDLVTWQISSIPTAIDYRKKVLSRRRQAANIVDPQLAAPSGYVDSEGNPIDMWTVYRMAKLIGDSWRPRPLATRGVLIRGRALVDMLPGYDRAHGWSGLFRRGFDVVQAEGDHLTILTPQHSDILSAHIADVLDRCGMIEDRQGNAGRQSGSARGAEQRGFGQSSKDLKIYLPAGRS